MEIQKSEIKDTFQAEVARKGIHLASLWIPIAGLYADRSFMVLLTALIAFIAIWLDFERFQRSAIGLLILKYCGFMLRKHERRGKFSIKSMSGSVWLHAAASITFFFFAREVAVAATAMLILCDTAAALIGKRFGTFRFGEKKKSLEGCLAFFVTGMIIIAVVPGIGFFEGFCAVIVALLAEAILHNLDDNFTVPLSAAIVMTLL